MRIGIARSPLVDGSFLSAAAIDQLFPYVCSIISRSPWTICERGDVDRFVRNIGDHRSGTFNSFTHFHFGRPEQAAALSEYALDRRLHRLAPNASDGASREEVAMEWERLVAESDEIVSWGDSTGMLRAVVQAYRFKRHIGSSSTTAHEAAAKLIAKEHPAIKDPLKCAGVLIEWCEKKHRAWFWQCCPDHHVLYSTANSGNLLQDRS